MWLPWVWQLLLSRSVVAMMPLQVICLLTTDITGTLLLSHSITGQFEVPGAQVLVREPLHHFWLGGTHPVSHHNQL